MWNLVSSQEPARDDQATMPVTDLHEASGSTMDLFHELWGLGYAQPEDEDARWQDFALCAQTDPDIFFPEKGGSTIPATSVCSSCRVREQCLEYALSHDIRHGIWGGLSDNDRRKITRQRRRVAGGN